ncbi:MAG: cyanophycin synthetase, partial [Bacilli bacterium]
TPDATDNILRTVKALNYQNIYTVIGCGGERDKEKRPIMGLIASNLSDYVIFTSDNPRTEEPQQIIADMIQKLDKKNYEIVINRQNAINKGIQKLQKDDILLILGKGHEKYQVIGKEKIEFADKKIILDIIGR